MPKTRKFSTREEASIALFNDAKEAIEAATNEFRMLISGGSSPLRFFELLGSWLKEHPEHAKKVHVAWVDERLVPIDSDRSNYKGASSLWSHIPGNQVYPVPVDMYDENLLVNRYEEQLKEAGFIYSGKLKVDLALLGMGDDGHTASLFPDTPLIIQKDYYGIAAPKFLEKRITIRAEVVEDLTNKKLVIFGQSKADLYDKVNRAVANVPVSLALKGGPIVYLTLSND